jgi:hypothetical protein
MKSNRLSFLVLLVVLSVLLVAIPAAAEGDETLMWVHRTAVVKGGWLYDPVLDREACPVFLVP